LIECLWSNRRHGDMTCIQVFMFMEFEQITPTIAEKPMTILISCGCMRQATYLATWSMSQRHDRRPKYPLLSCGTTWCPHRTSWPPVSAHDITQRDSVSLNLPLRHLVSHCGVIWHPTTVWFGIPVASLAIPWHPSAAWLGVPAVSLLTYGIPLCHSASLDYRSGNITELNPSWSHNQALHRANF
jgi:hypothetical protein